MHKVTLLSAILVLGLIYANGQALAQTHNRADPASQAAANSSRPAASSSTRARTSAAGVSDIVGGTGNQSQQRMHDKYGHSSGRRRRDDGQIVARRAIKQPPVLGGDLNGTPWESAIDPMQRIARFIDPRQGYGYLPTYDAQSRWMAWPLDQIFYQAGFALVSLKRLGNIGSDHYPYLARLCRIAKQRGQQPPAPEPQAIAHAKQTIKRAKKRDAGGHRGKN